MATLTFLLLIEPEGIETYYEYLIIHAASVLLIEPEGIETCMLG